MPNPTVSSIDTGTAILGSARTATEVVTLAATTTYKDFTVLARDSSTLKLVPFVKGGVTNGNGVAKAILLKGLTTVGSGDYSVDVLIGGDVINGRLVIHADGNATNIDGAVRDALRDYGIHVLISTQTAVLDN